MSDISTTDPSRQHIGNTHDITFELLLRLPVPSVLCFRTVSKLWHSISTSPYFLISHTRHHRVPNPSALLHSNETYPPTFLHAPLTRKHLMPRPALTFAVDDLGIRIIHSCNGLLLCYSNYKLTDGTNGSLYVLNPTFNSFESIPYPNSKSLDKPHAEFTLVFNPADAPKFKLICAWSSDITFHNHHQHPNNNQTFKIELFSSETQSWRILGNFTFKSNFIKQLACGVFWHNAIHWLDPTTGPLCFDLKTEHPKSIPKPPVNKEDIFTTKRFTYLGVCNDRLTIVKTQFLNTELINILQLNTHQSLWNLTHRVNLDQIGKGHPEMMSVNEVFEKSCCFYVYSVLSLVEDEEGDDVDIVVAIPGKIVCYSLKMNVTRVVCLLNDGEEASGDVFRYEWKNAHKLIHSFALC